MRYKIEKYVGSKCECDYGWMMDWADVELIVRGYKKDEDYARFGILAFTRKNSKTVYLVEVKED